MAERPASRQLRILSFDPSLATRLETSTINELTANILWEDDLEPGPIGEYLEVVDADPASGVFYNPVDLNNPYLLAQDGLRPSESNPQFHQQMVYAVAMTTIRHFERALGRMVLWANHVEKVQENGATKYADQFVRRLRLYPHALRDQNAYYSPDKKAILFGYFPVTAKDADNTPGTIVFTCLSHDIIAHEVTHALLDGVHPRFNEPTNPDVLAFHEAFADVVALFQHFTYPQVLENQISRSRGSLHSETLLSQLAQQFGKATGRGAALRDALGQVNPETGKWEPLQPDPQALENVYEPHDRGAILVAAIFRAFLLVYRARTADLFRIATQGTGTLPEGDIHPDLTKRLAMEAAGTADRILQMCIRAIDYCPPVDISFGDFLRGAITADLDYSPSDATGFRVAFIESFRDWGIYPRGVHSMGLDALVWPGRSELLDDSSTRLENAQGALKKHLENFVETATESWSLEGDRFAVWQNMQEVRRGFWGWLKKGDDAGREFAHLFGLVMDESAAPPTVNRGRGGPAVEVHSVRPALRRTADGSVLTDLVVEVTQSRRGYFDPNEQEKQDKPSRAGQENGPPDFYFRRGATILIDPRRSEIRRVMRTRDTIADQPELDRVRSFLTGGILLAGNAFDAGLPNSLRRASSSARNEPFALVHQLEEA